jgi:hypothetical protein
MTGAQLLNFTSTGTRTSCSDHTERFRIPESEQEVGASFLLTTIDDIIYSHIQMTGAQLLNFTYCTSQKPQWHSSRVQLARSIKPLV